MAGRLVVLAVCLMITGASSSRPSTSSLRPASVVSPVLSEFVAKNERGILDEDGRSSDYLLLRNPAREWCAGPTHDERRRVRLTPTEWRTTGASATPLRPVWVYAQSRLPLQGFALTVTRSAGDGVSPSAWPFPEVRRTRLRRTAAHGTTGSPVVNALYAHSRLQRRSIERGKGAFRVCSYVSVRTLPLYMYKNKPSSAPGYRTALAQGIAHPDVGSRGTPPADFHPTSGSYRRVGLWQGL
jgi:hypothetical protein